mgnify:FL=1
MIKSKVFQIVLLMGLAIVIFSCEPEPCYDNQGFEVSCYEVSH